MRAYEVSLGFIVKCHWPKNHCEASLELTMDWMVPLGAISSSFGHIPRMFVYIVKWRWWQEMELGYDRPYLHCAVAFLPPPANLQGDYASDAHRQWLKEGLKQQIAANSNGAQVVEYIDMQECHWSFHYLHDYQWRFRT